MMNIDIKRVRYLAGKQNRISGYIRVPVHAHRVGDRGITRLRPPTEVGATPNWPRGGCVGGLFRLEDLSEIEVWESGR